MMIPNFSSSSISPLKEVLSELEWDRPFPSILSVAAKIISFTIACVLPGVFENIFPYQLTNSCVSKDKPL